MSSEKQIEEMARAMCREYEHYCGECKERSTKNMNILADVCLKGGEG